MADAHDSVPTPCFTWRRARFAAALVIGLLVAGALIRLRYSLSRTEFPLYEVADDEAQPLAGSADFGCGTSPDAAVSKYPPFISSAPLFGFLNFVGNESSPVTRYSFALDESRGTGTGYDVLYFDGNANHNLTDDKSVRASGRSVDKTGVVSIGFDDFAIPYDFGSPVGTHDFTVAACLRTEGSGYYMHVRPATIRRGAIRIGRNRYEAALSVWSFAARYDGPGTQIHLKRPWHVVLFPHPGEVVDAVNAHGASFPLDTMLPVKGRWYRFSTTPLGDVLKVTAHQGDVGTFEVSGGLGDAKAVGAIGNTDSYLRITSPDTLYEFNWAMTNRLELPAGDYFFNNMLVTSGIYDIHLERNNATAGTYRWWKTPQPQYLIKIRKEAPFTLSLPDKPGVVFGMPDQDQRLRPGETLYVRSMLVIPGTDICIREIEMRRKALTADILVTDSSGLNLAHGTLPIFDLIYKGFSWQVPSDLVLPGPEERLTVTVTCDTGGLFGKVESSRQVIVEAPEGN